MVVEPKVLDKPYLLLLRAYDMEYMQGGASGNSAAMPHTEILVYGKDTKVVEE